MRVHLNHQNPGSIETAVNQIKRIKSKLALCIRSAKAASRDSWGNNELTPHQREVMRAIARESIEDARYWQRQLVNEAALDVTRIVRNN